MPRPEWLSDCPLADATLYGAHPRPIVTKKSMLKLPHHPPLFMRPNSTDRTVLRTAQIEFPALVAALTSVVETNRNWTILDAGANAGFASRHFAEKMPGARIVAVEAEAGNYAVLRKNTAHYPGVLALHAAIWGHEAETMSVVDGNRDASRWGREWQYMVAASNNSNSKVVNHQPQSVTVSSLLKELCLPRFDLVKLDIEGAEASVFGKDAVLSWLDGGFQFMYWEAHEDMVRGSEQAMIDVLQQRSITVVIPATRDSIYFACSHGISTGTCLAACTRWRSNFSAWLPPCFPADAPICSVLAHGLAAPRDGLDRISRASGLPRERLICPKKRVQEAAAPQPRVSAGGTLN